MSEPDASERESIGTGPAPDVSDGFDASHGYAELPNEGALDLAGSAGKQGRSRPRAPRVRSTAAAPDAGLVALLDSVRSGAPFDPRESTGERRTALDAFERRIPFEVFHAVWPMLDSYRGSALDLVSLSITSPDGEGIAESAHRFALDVAHDGGAGVLLALDRGRRPAHAHYHGLALTPDVGRLRDLWCELAGAAARLTRTTPVTGWPLDAEDRERSFAKNLAGVVWYAFEPLPPWQARRSLTRDVYASGVFSAPWRAARATLEAWPDLTGDRVGKPSGNRRTCERCGTGIRPGKRSHARYCGPHCQKAAWEEQHPWRKGERRKGAPSTPDGAP